MGNSTVKKMDAFLQRHNQDFKVLLFKIKTLQDLNDRFAQFIDKTMLPYCQVANFRDDYLVVLAANGSVATQLRLNKLDLLAKFKHEPLLNKIRDIQVKVTPNFKTDLFPDNQSKTSSTPILSDKTAAIIKDVAESVQDEKLKNALERIASNIKKPRLKSLV